MCAGGVYEQSVDALVRGSGLHRLHRAAPEGPHTRAGILTAVFFSPWVRKLALGICFILKGTVSRDFRPLVFIMIFLPQSDCSLLDSPYPFPFAPPYSLTPLHRLTHTGLIPCPNDSVLVQVCAVRLARKSYH
jgi:hypothetical protein